MSFIVNGQQLKEYPEIREQMFRLRYKVFIETKGWDLPTKNGLEIDQYDTDDTIYILHFSAHGAVIGQWRLIPTTGPYMLKETFPEFAEGYLPKSPKAWESSRFALLIDPKTNWFAFEKAAREMLCTLSEFALLNGIEEIISLHEPTMTPLSNQLLGTPHRMNKPRPSGKAFAQAVYYRPDFLRQLNQTCELYSFQRPVTSVYDIASYDQVMLAAE